MRACLPPLVGSKVQVMQEALAKSNEVFSTFKTDTEKLRKRIKVTIKYTCIVLTLLVISSALEKERKDQLMKAESTEKNLTEITKENEQMKRELNNIRKQKERLEALCRTLTQERAQWKASLKGGDGDECESDKPEVSGGSDHEAQETAEGNLKPEPDVVGLSAACLLLYESLSFAPLHLDDPVAFHLLRPSLGFPSSSGRGGHSDLARLRNHHPPGSCSHGFRVTPLPPRSRTVVSESRAYEINSD
eukprot:765231-Hanusia_phi.AAC.2